MNGADAPLPADDPRMIAWKAYKDAGGYEDTLRWARQYRHDGAVEEDRQRREQHVESSLWAAFVAGFKAGEQHHRRRTEPIGLPGADDES